MIRGKVVSFNDSRGFGFLKCENGRENIFIHYSNIISEGFKSLSAGDDVEFELYEVSESKLEARNLKKI